MEIKNEILNKNKKQEVDILGSVDGINKRISELEDVVKELMKNLRI